MKEILTIYIDTYTPSKYKKALREMYAKFVIPINKYTYTNGKFKAIEGCPKNSVSTPCIFHLLLK